MVQLKSNWKFLIVLSIMFFCFSNFTSETLASENGLNLTLIRQAALNLASNNQKLKEEAIVFLSAQDETAIPYFVQIMQENSMKNNLIGFEFVNLVDYFGIAGLPIIEQGLQDINPMTRRRAARAAFTFGSDAGSTVNYLAALVANNQEENDVRVQAIDALRAINTITPEVQKAFALALGGDVMLSWRITQAMTSLGITNDDILPILFKELSLGADTDVIIAAISRIIRSTTDPLQQLEIVFFDKPEEIKIGLFSIIADLYTAPNTSQTQLSDFLLKVIKTDSEVVQKEAVYMLGEKVSTEPEIIDILLNILEEKELTDSVVMEVYYALEKSDQKDQNVISLFVDSLVDENSPEELKMAAARYLEKSKIAAYPEMLRLLDHLEFLNEDVLWRLSPLFYHVAKEEPTVVDVINDLTKEGHSDFIQDYANRILSALGEAPSIKVEYATEAFDKVPAFPGAEGYGRYTVGGRGGKVYVVTNLNDTGPGSLRAAVDASGPRTIIFAVSGNIMLKEALNISNPYITIAGQTAPGEGITIAGAPVNIRTNNVIIRYLRFRMGDYNDHEADAIGGRGVSDIILDHITASWSTDECVSFYLTDNLTVQWSFITESLRGSVHVKGNHGYGGIWGGFSSFHHNLLAHHSSRNPRFDAERTLDEPATDMRNNVIYNWGFNSTYGGEGGNHNMIANYYKPGPGTGLGAVNYRILDLSNGGRWYIADNYVHGYPAITADNWAGGVQIRIGKLSEVKAETPFPAPYVTTHTAEEAYELVLENAGAILPVRDAIDQRIVEEVRSGTATYGGTYGAKSGIIDSQEDVGGLIFLRSYSAPLDSDGDGIPDWWAIKYGFNPIGGVDPSGDLDGDGYTNLEEYLNGTNPIKADAH